MGNGYFGTAQTRKDKRKAKDFAYNYVDRIRLADGSLQDQRYPVRGFGWRHKSVSHLDLATSCHASNSRLSHWSAQRELRPSRSLDYNHINRCKDTFDIAEFYWRVDPEEYYDNQQTSGVGGGGGGGGGEQKAGLRATRCQHKDVTLYRDYADETYHSTNSIYSPPQQQPDQHQRHLLDAHQQQIQPFDVGNDSCSLRRSRSLAVIREETFNDLQTTSTNSGRRRSQLIPRARLVNRGFHREHEARFNCANNKNHHPQSSREKLSNDTEQDALENGSAIVTEPHPHPPQQHPVQHCHHHHHHHHNSQQQHHSHHHLPPCQKQIREADDYYDNLKRLDASAANGENLHPWHNDKSDLESLNSDYFKNSLHQSHEIRQPPEQTQQELEKETTEQTAGNHSEKPRIYQSKRQQRAITEKTIRTQSQATKAPATNGVDSCPETSQSSVFPETTPSNSDDQTDSPSLSEQEYDLTRIEELYQQTKLEQDEEESYEVISLSTTVRTRIESTEEEEEPFYEGATRARSSENISPAIETETEGTLKRTRALSENLEKLIAYDSVYLSSEEGSESTLIEERIEASGPLTAAGEQAESDARTKTTVLHICIEDTVFDSPLHSCGEQLEDDDVDVKDDTTSIVREEKILKQGTLNQTETKEKVQDSTVLSAPPLYTQILKVEHSTQSSTSVTPATDINIPTISTPSAAVKPRILAAVEKRKLKRAADCLNNVSNENSNPSNVQSHPYSHPHTSNGLVNKLCPSIKAANFFDNKYHSLPDINIGKSLKVSERIDAKLRSSYYVKTCQKSDEGISDCRLRKAKTSISLQHRKDDSRVTTEQINDSIKKFGQEHQKARLREYEDLYEESIVRDEVEVCGKKQCLEKTKTTTQKNTTKKVNVNVKEKQEEQATGKSITNSTEREEIRETCEESFSETNTRADASAPNGTEVLNELSEEQTSESSQLTESNEEYQEQPKEAPSIEVPQFTREIERRAKEIQQIAAANKAKKEETNKKHDRVEELEGFHSYTFTSTTFRINKPANNFPRTTAPCGNTSEITATNPFRIIVTDAQDNVIEEDSIEGQHIERLNSLTKEGSTKTTATAKLSQDEVSGGETTREKVQQSRPLETPKGRDKSRIATHNKGAAATSSLKRVPSKPKKPQLTCQHQQCSSDPDYLSTNQKSKARRVLSTQIYKARPVKILATNESFRRAAITSEMSRPQIMHVIDNKRSADIAAATAGRAGSSNAGLSNMTQMGENHVESEYLKKVDAVRSYWSKLAQNVEGEEDKEEDRELERQHQPQRIPETHCERHEQPRHFHLGAQQQSVTEKRAKSLNEMSTSRQDECSFVMPSIEIVELDGDKTAAIVSAVPPSATADTLSNGAKEPQFDHIRYKVMKSQQLLRGNIYAARHKKEAQFDGLIQYLQDYSFQELLSNNNVVIVEPVRTKIERPLQMHAKNTEAAGGCAMGRGDKIMAQSEKKEPPENRVGREGTFAKNDAADKISDSDKNKQSSGIKRHFFYQPVRVNRELYEEELPHPDTVRNVRKFFEEHILPTPEGGITVLPSNGDLRAGTQEYPQLSPRSRRVRKYRYLTIDTSYGHPCEVTANSAQPHGSRARWDSASVSSGISSGDLSSPCDCNEPDTSVAGQPNGKTSGEQHQRQHHTVLTSRTDELKGVHVREVIRLHNTANQGWRRVSETDTMADVSNGKCRVSLNSHNMRGVNSHQPTKGEGNDKFPDEDDGNEDDEDDDDGDCNDEEDDELSESYYVSNDVLQKIREYGSSVTYYGGRVLQWTPPDPHNQSSNIASCSNALGTVKPQQPTVATTKARVKEFESCSSTCRPNECPHHQEPKKKFSSQMTTEERKKEVSVATRGNDKDPYLGVKFKLIKSNSCSSRLELVGAVEDKIAEDKEVVKDIVKRLEATRSTEGAEEQSKLKKNRTNKTSALTINNQMPNEVEAPPNAPSASSECLPKVTVNNHITVPTTPDAAKASTHTTNLPSQGDLKVTGSEKRSLLGKGHEMAGEQKNSDDLKERETFESSAMDIHLDVTSMSGVEIGRKNTKSNSSNSNNNNIYCNGNVMAKICRNKNVDLAFTMTRQQQQRQQINVKSLGVKNDAKKNYSFQTTPQRATLEPQQHKEKQLPTSSQTNQGNGAINVADSEGPALRTSATETTIRTNNDTADNTLGINAENLIKTPRNSTEINKSPDNPKPINQPTTLTATETTQAVVDTYQGNSTESSTKIGLCVSKSPISITSSCSTAPSKDKTFVRHYVANDKSLLECRKYDDIEFEEFEVYDPSKDAERLAVSSGGEGERGRADNKPQRASSAGGDSSSLNDDVMCKSAAYCCEDLSEKL